MKICKPLHCETQRFSNISTSQSWLETIGIETLPKFNLMEENYGNNWAKEWTEIMPTFCTIGKHILKHS